MENSAFETFIQKCGSVKQAAKILGLKREHVSAMRQRRIEVSLLNALMIEKYMQEHKYTEIHHTALVSPWMRNQLKRLSFHLDYPTIELIKVPINNVTCSTAKIESLPGKNESNLHQLRPIIIDENQQLIANPNTYFVYQQQNKYGSCLEIIFPRSINKKICTYRTNANFFSL